MSQLMMSLPDKIGEWWRRWCFNHWWRGWMYWCTPFCVSPGCDTFSPFSWTIKWKFDDWQTLEAERELKWPFLDDLWWTSLSKVTKIILTYSLEHHVRHQNISPCGQEEPGTEPTRTHSTTCTSSPSSVRHSWVQFPRAQLQYVCNDVWKKWTGSFIVLMSLLSAVLQPGLTKRCMKNTPMSEVILCVFLFFLHVTS